MLPYLFAIAIAVASLSLFVTAFFSPKWHRKDDFLWSGVGLIYALVLWICAEQIRGSVLLGQGAATLLVLSLIWQTVQLRKLLAISDKSTELTALSFTAAVQKLWAKKNKKGIAVQPPASVASAPANIPSPVEPIASPTPEPQASPSDWVESITESPAIAALIETEDEAENSIEEESLEQLAPPEDSPLPDVTDKFPTISAQPTSPKPKKSGFSLTALFGRKKPKTDNIPNLKPEALTELLDRQDEAINAQEDAEWNEITETVSEGVAPSQEPVEAEDGDWDDVFESLAPETQIETIQESVTEAIAPVQEQVEVVIAEVTEVTEVIVPETPIEEIKEAVTEAIAPLQEQVEALEEKVSEAIEQNPGVTDAIADIADTVETESSAFVDQVKAQAETAIDDFETENKDSQ